MAWIRCLLFFSLMCSAIQCIRRAHSLIICIAQLRTCSSCGQTSQSLNQISTFNLNYSSSLICFISVYSFIFSWFMSSALHASIFTCTCIFTKERCCGTPSTEVGEQMTIVSMSWHCKYMYIYRSCSSLLHSCNLVPKPSRFLEGTRIRG